MRARRRLVRTGRMATVVMVRDRASPGSRSSTAPQGLYNYLQAVQGYLAPPIFMVFFFGIFSSDSTPRAASGRCWWGSRSGCFAWSWIRRSGSAWRATARLHAGSFLWIVNNIYFQYFSVLITIVSAIVMVVVSYATAPPSDAQLTGLTYATITPDKIASRARAGAPSRWWDRRWWSARSSEPTCISTGRRDRLRRGRSEHLVRPRSCEPDSVSTDSNVATVGARSFKATVAS